MKGNKLEEILELEAQHAEEHKDAPLRDGTVITHRGQRSHVFSIRLSDDERAQLELAAAETGVAPSALARQWIGERLSTQSAPTDLGSIANTLATLSATLRSLPRP
jgi:hypothetical protein